MENDLIHDYKTTHVPLAAYLKLKGYQVTKVSCEGRRGVFVFAFIARDHIIDFNNGQATVEPNEFAEKMSQLTQTAKRVINDGEH